MAEQSNALTLIQKNKKEIVNIVQNEQFKKQLAAALMSRLPLDYVVRSSISTINSNSKIQECTPLSIAASILLLAQAGLAPEPWKGHGYLIPRSTKVSKRGEPDRWEMQCTALIGYRGYVNLAYRSPEVAKAIAHPVYEGDIFDLDQVNGSVTHKPWIRPEEGRQVRGNILGAYALVKMKNGEPLVEWMPKVDIDATRSRSASSDKGPWETDYAEMARKTPFRRLFKWIPDADLQRIAALEEASEFGQTAVTIDATTGEIITQVLDVAEQNQQQQPAIQMPQRQALPESRSVLNPAVQGNVVKAEPQTINAQPVQTVEKKAAQVIEQTVPEDDAPDDGKPKDYGFGAPPETEPEPASNTQPLVELISPPKAEEKKQQTKANTIGPGKAKRIRAICNAKKTRNEAQFEELKATFKIEHLEDFPADKYHDLELWAERAD